MDATIIEAPSSTKNLAGERDPEMHQTNKGNQWHFGIQSVWRSCSSWATCWRRRDGWGGSMPRGNPRRLSRCTQTPLARWEDGMPRTELQPPRPGRRFLLFTARSNII